jgi:hypothetical protein
VTDLRSGSVPVHTGELYVVAGADQKVNVRRPDTFNTLVLHVPSLWM